MMNLERMLFGGWESIIRILVIGVLGYVGLIGILRCSGKRTLSKMNAFDLVVTVALGSTLATILLTRDVTLADGLAALGLLVGLQFVVTWSTVRVRWLRQFVTGEPLMLLYRGTFLPTALSRARVNEEDVEAAVRSAGLASFNDVEAVVLETDGSLSVVRRSTLNNRTSLKHVRRPHETAEKAASVAENDRGAM